MHSEMVRGICQIGIFIICAQMLAHFRPDKAYDKYFKLLVSAMVLLQVLRPLGGLFGIDGDKVQARAQWYAELFGAGFDAAVQSGERAELLRERMTMEEVRRRLEEEQREVEEEQGRVEEERGRVEEERGRVEEEQGRVEEGQGRVEEGQGRVEEGQGRVEEGQGRVEEERGRLEEERREVERQKDTAGIAPVEEILIGPGKGGEAHAGEDKGDLEEVFPQG